MATADTACMSKAFFSTRILTASAFFAWAAEVADWTDDVLAMFMTDSEAVKGVNVYRRVILKLEALRTWLKQPESPFDPAAASKMPLYQPVAHLDRAMSF